MATEQPPADRELREAFDALRVTLENSERRNPPSLVVVTATTAPWFLDAFNGASPGPLVATLVVWGGWFIAVWLRPHR